MYLHEFFNDVYRLHRLRDASPNTIRLYGCTIRSFQKYLKRKAQLDDLNDDTISSFLSARSESVSSQTCRKEYDQLTSLWRYANSCLLYTSPSPRDGLLSRMPSSA